jgi:hypothetical protein
MKRLLALLFRWHEFPVPVIPPGGSVVATTPVHDDPKWKPKTVRDAVRIWLAERRLLKERE